MHFPRVTRNGSAEATPASSPPDGRNLAFDGPRRERIRRPDDGGYLFALACARPANSSFETSSLCVAIQCPRDDGEIACEGFRGYARGLDSERGGRRAT
jgi:hypothetical protein